MNALSALVHCLIEKQLSHRSVALDIECDRRRSLQSNVGGLVSGHGVSTGYTPAASHLPVPSTMDQSSNGTVTESTPPSMPGSKVMSIWLTPIWSASVMVMELLTNQVVGISLRVSVLSPPMFSS